MAIDWNKLVANKAGNKIKQLDIKNGGELLKTMQEFIKWADKYRRGAQKYGDEIEVNVSKDITYKGIKGHGWCRVVFNKFGDVLRYEY